MNIEKRSANTYRARLMIDGKSYSATFDHKPSEREAYEVIMKKVRDDSGIKGSFKQFANDYIAIKEGILSPRTVKEYVNTLKYIPEWFLSLDLGELKASDVQRCINEIAVGRSPKTVRNYHGFIASVINMYRPDFVLKTTLPQKEKSEDYIPTEEDVRRILDCAVGTENEVFLKLACMGLRRSEICALEITDIDVNNVVHINKALVLDKDNNWVVKSTKTTASTRTVPIPEQLATQIRTQGYVYRQSPNNVIKWLNKTQDQLGIPRFQLHKLRHFFASQLADKNVPAKTIMELGGWETDGVMKTVYQHNMKQENEKRNIISNLTDGLF
jgi:integrase